MTRQATQSQSDVTPYEDMLLKRFRMVESVVEKAKEFNNEHMIDDRTSNANVMFRKTNKQKGYEKWLKQCVNPDTNRFHDMSYLKAKQLVSPLETPYDNIKYPRRELFQLYRIKTQSGEYLKRVEMWYCLDNNGFQVCQQEPASTPSIEGSAPTISNSEPDSEGDDNESDDDDNGDENGGEDGDNEDNLLFD